jgi:hypothetical protein
LFLNIATRCAVAVATGAIIAFTAWCTIIPITARTIFAIPARRAVITI